jgi:DNA invertase Pin-like site-specific DNA recombinase
MPRKPGPKKRNPLRAIGYLRVSTEDQNLGPEAQRALLERWCAANGAELVEVHQDHGISGGAPIDKRPALMAAIDALELRDAGVLLVAKRDRLARDIVAAAMIERLAERAGARVLTADGVGNGEGPEAQMMRGILDVFAQYERALIRHRTRMALGVKRSRGEKLGGEPPFGSRVAPGSKRLEPDPAELATMERVREWRAAGVSIRGIAERLNAAGVPSRGRRWHATTIVNLLRRAAG